MGCGDHMKTYELLDWILNNMRGTLPPKAPLCVSCKATAHKRGTELESSGAAAGGIQKRRSGGTTRRAVDESVRMY